LSDYEEFFQGERFSTEQGRHISILFSSGWVEISAQIYVTNEGFECIAGEKELLDYSAIG